MAYIDPEGMFGGDRMAMLSDSAKLAWPWFWCASNTVGRVELNYGAFLRGPFRQFKKPPTERQFWVWVEEFHAAHLLFAYQLNGQAWGQWDVTEKYLPTYKTKRDEKTPAPVARLFLEWKKKYLEGKQSALFDKCSVLNVSENFSKIPEDFEHSLLIETEIEIEELKPSAAEAAGVLTFPDPISGDDLIAETAERICTRHPQVRTCGANEAGKKLKAIVAKLPKAERAAKLASIDANHQGWCQSAQWTKDGGEYAKGLEAWLAPTKFRYDLLPPARGSPKRRSSVIEHAPTEGTMAEKIEALRWLIENSDVPEDAILHRRQLAELEGKHAG